MKILAVLWLLSIPTFAKKKPAYDHTAKAVYHEMKRKYLLEGYPGDKLFYDGDYICTEGTQNYAPGCRKSMDWWIKTQSPYAEITLDDGRKAIILFDRPTPGEIMLEDGTDPMKLYDHEHMEEVAHKSLPHEGPSFYFHLRRLTLMSNPLDIIFRDWGGAKHPADLTEMTFHYTITKNKLGEEEIDLAP